MASHDTSRKKRKMSHMDARPFPSSDTTPVIASSSALPLPHPSVAGMDNPKHATPCRHEQSLQALNTDLEAMRQLVTCKICDRLLYEPYALSCGHTYCYSCLSQWLGSNAKMTCPDCRIVIRQQPTPSYLIRELVLVFVSRNELLPDGETTEEHNKQVKEEAEIVAKDKANTDNRTGGLFKGRFNRSRQNILGPLHDPGDGVDRCPACYWELEEGHCNSCGYEADDLDGDFSDPESDSAISDEDVDLDLRDMDEDGFMGPDEGDEWRLGPQIDGVHGGNMIYRAPGRWNRWRRHAPPDDPHAPIDLASSEEESEADDYDRNDTFIDDEAIDGSSAESDVTAGRSEAPPGRARNIRFRPAPVVISDDEDEDEEVRVVRPRRPAAQGRLARRRATPIVLSQGEEEEEGNETAPSTTQGADESSSESDDEGPIVRGSQRNKRPNVAVRSRPALPVSSDDDSDHSELDGASDNAAQGGFSPIDDGFGDGLSQQTDYEDDDGDDVNDGFLGATFNPEEASVGGYNDESDDGFGTATTSNRHAHRPRPAPSARLGTLQQRRPRHLSPTHRSPTAPSPTAGGDSWQHEDGFTYRRIFDNRIDPHSRLALGIDPRTGLLATYGEETQSQPEPQPQQWANHPFHLGNILSRINSDAHHQATNDNSNMNRVLAGDFSRRYQPPPSSPPQPWAHPNSNQRPELARQTRSSPSADWDHGRARPHGGGGGAGMTLEGAIGKRGT